MAIKPKTTPKAADTEPTIEAVKGFNADWTCRGFQYEIGKTYTHDGPVVRCAKGGFHAIDGNPLDVLDFYPLIGSKFADVVLGGKIARDVTDSKVAAGEITIKAEIQMPDFINRAVAWMIKHVAGNASQLAASGYASQLAASGYASQLAASGDGSQLAASGNDSKLAASGNDSVAAASGLGSVVTLGKNGAAAIAWHDGKRTRFATIYVGEDGIEAGVAYCVRGGRVVRAEG